ncbi:hypothetical protein D0Z07_7168 [Hyphodiscus hymeniophilus]|uniref:Uncharacterized protein n=1 Tax=Hyphodiscus hymeniophilus TaxID=353542 RepID=A0A9P6VGA7_9HELO|nr:hypothetical protein D0Z07_7168 [Hyphodiscus hymeniophilus]
MADSGVKGVTVKLDSAMVTAPGAYKNLFIEDQYYKRLKISLRRTIRVPDNGESYGLPPDCGAFPIYSVAKYTSRLPQKVVAKGGVFIPMHQREAMWINFEGSSEFAVKIYVGGVNAISVPIPPTPVTAATYAEHGYPFFKLYEDLSGVSGNFEQLQSVGDLDKAKGHFEVHDSEVDVSFPSVALNTPNSVDQMEEEMEDYADGDDEIEDDDDDEDEDEVQDFDGDKKEDESDKPGSTNSSSDSSTIQLNIIDPKSVFLPIRLLEKQLRK